MAEYQITVTPVPPNASTTGGWRWVVVDGSGQAYSSPNVYGAALDAKTAAEQYANLLEGTETYTYTPSGGS